MTAPYGSLYAFDRGSNTCGSLMQEPPYFVDCPPHFPLQTSMPSQFIKALPLKMSVAGFVYLRVFPASSVLLLPRGDFFSFASFSDAPTVLCVKRTASACKFPRQSKILHSPSGHSLTEASDFHPLSPSLPSPLPQSRRSGCLLPPKPISRPRRPALWQWQRRFQARRRAQSRQKRCCS